MSTEIAMPEAQRRELVHVLESMAVLVEEARQCLLDGDDLLAIIPLDVIREGLLPLRNGIGQWHNRVTCPKCGLEGPNVVAVRQGESEGSAVWPVPHHFADIGFRCQFCKNEWGFEVSK